MAKILVAILGVIFYCAIAIKGESYVTVYLWENGNCGGHKDTYSFERTCYSYPSYGYKISGVSVPIGSCLHIFKGLTCTGDTYKIAYPSSSACELPCCGWNDHVLSVRDCSTRNVNVYCPTNTYVRQIFYNAANQGLAIQCYKPGENTPAYTGYTHGSSPSNPNVNSCPVAAHGLSMSYSNAWRMYTTPTMECSRKFDVPTENKTVTEYLHKLDTPTHFVDDIGQDSNITVGAIDDSKNGKEVVIQALCSTGYAFSGVTVNIDEANVIKEVTNRCTKVADPTTMCEPQESLGLVMQCDNSESSNEMECSYSKTVGVGQSKTMTETERQEMTFSMEFGFSVEAGIPGLSASMSASLGMSELVGYEWSRSDTTTWTEETTVTATIKLQPHTKTKLEQLVGKCSFYGTSVNFFKQSDMNVKTGKTTVKYFST